MRVAIIGRTQVLYESALRLSAQGHQICCVITAKAAPEYSRKEEDFRLLAGELGAPFLLTNTLDRPEFEELCKGLDVGVSVNWVSVILQRHIDLFRLGILNAHHGDLPRYRGNACSNWAILNGEERITNTIHLMEGDRLDCGRIIHQHHLELNAGSTITDVYRWWEETAPDAFVQAINKLSADSGYTLRYADPQGEESFRCYPRLPEDGYIDWTLPATRVHNLVRAVCHPFPGAYTYHLYQGEIRRLIVLKSRVLQEQTKDLAAPGHVLKNDKQTGESHVQCGEGTIALVRCRYEGEPQEFSPGERWNSIRMRLGIRAEDWLWNLLRDQRA
jgi:methionyl-tRNA formyltransferase